MALNILIVEEAPTVATLLSEALRGAGFHPLSARSIAQARTFITAVIPDLILVDVTQVDEATSFVLESRNAPNADELPIYLLVAPAVLPSMQKQVTSRCTYFMPKPISPSELIAKIRAAIRKSAATVEGVSVSALGLTLQLDCRKVFTSQSRSKQKVQLGPMEARILYFLMTNAERVHTRDQLLEQVWGNHALVNERSVDVHVKRLRDALDSFHFGAIIETVRGRGYRLANKAPCFPHDLQISTLTRMLPSLPPREVP